MAKYKVLDSIAHNTAHSFLAATNYFDGGFPFEHLLRSCREAKISKVHIDLLERSIDPRTLDDKYVREALKTLGYIFDGQLESGGWTRAGLRGATIELDLAAGTCISRITDDRGVEHSKPVAQWGGVDWNEWKPVFENLRA
jgi:hypothetical protein